MSLNLEINGIGHLGADCELKAVDDRFVVNYNLACTDKFGSGENKREKTTWVRCTSWYNTKPTIEQYLKKGVQVAFKGTPSVSAYQNQSGESVGNLEVTVRELKLLSSSNSRQEQQSQAVPAPSAQQQQQKNDASPVAGAKYDDTQEEDDDLPF